MTAATSGSCGRLRPDPSLDTVEDLVRWGAERLDRSEAYFGHGTDNAWDEAAWVVLHVSGLPPDAPPHQWRRRLSRGEREEILSLLGRRVEARVPVAYLTNRAWFAGLEFFVDERVLVPRSPFGELIDQKFRPWVDPARVARILDIGTGSGCIAIACAYAFPGARIDAVDCSRDALAVARRNVSTHRLEERIRISESSLYEDAPGPYDLILSNPPYVDDESMARMPMEFRCEPRLGLAGGGDGLEVAVPILLGAQSRLTAHGVVAVEVGTSAGALVRRFPRAPFTWLELARGGDGVCLLGADELRAGALASSP